VPGSATNSLQELASLYGVQTAYYGVDHKRRPASAEALLAVLISLGAPVQGLNSAPDAVRQRQQELWRCVTEPVVVAWDGESDPVLVRVSGKISAGRWEARLELENGEVQEWLVDPSDLADLERLRLDGEEYFLKSVELPSSLPLGYHRFHLTIPGIGTAESLVISAPSKALSWGDKPNVRGWGVFLPLYALHSDRTLGTGDFTSLAELAEWVSGLGGNMVGTLPLLATYLDEPFDPSPYSPVSRLMWNELYLDVGLGDSISQSSPSSDVLDRTKATANGPLVDYQETAALKRRVLESQATDFYSGDSRTKKGFLRFLAENPEIERYAEFRAVMERRREAWQHWPARLRSGAIQPNDFDPDACRYHQYAQWLAEKQIDGMTSRASQNGVAMYLDLPLGVHPAGFDTWRWPDQFTQGIQAGAPPDLFSTKGQMWGFPPIHPQKMREDRYDYVIQYMRHHLRHADVLRVDHVMGLHRLFWVPQGMDARQGVYARYPADELYAILTLESKRHNTVIVGEDLGAVPRYVRPAMKRHGIKGLYVSYLEMKGASGLRKVPSNSMASVNTHDMAPFAAFLKGSDLNFRIDKGLLEPEQGEEALQSRVKMTKSLRRFLSDLGLTQGPWASSEELLRALLGYLGQSAAPTVLVGLEDLWLETQPQNVPGTEMEYPNWRRRSQYSFEQFSRMPQVLEALALVDRARKGQDGES